MKGKAFSLISKFIQFPFWSSLVSYSHLLSCCLSGSWYFSKAFADIRLPSSAINDLISLERLVVVLQPFRSEHPSDVLFMSCRTYMCSVTKQTCLFGVVAAHTVTGGMKKIFWLVINENDERCQQEKPTPPPVTINNISSYHTIFSRFRDKIFPPIVLGWG